MLKILTPFSRAPGWKPKDMYSERLDLLEVLDSEHTYLKEVYCDGLKSQGKYIFNESAF